MTNPASNSRIARAAIVRSTVLLLACLASGGSTAASVAAGGTTNAIQRNAVQPIDTESRDARASGARQFDLECEAIHHAFFDEAEDGVMDPPARPSIVTRHIRVDLAARQFCDSAWCEMAGLARIPAITGDRITLFDTRGPGDLNVEIFDRQTGRYIRRTHTIGLIWLDEGTCRERPFSGFPDGPRDMLVSDRNAVRDVATDPFPVLLDAYRIWASGIDRGIDEHYPIDRAEVRQFVEDARSVWAERIGRCTDGACEQSILADRVNRYNYSIGQPTAAIAGSGWDSGLLHFKAGPTTGRLIIFPIIDDTLLVQVATENRETGVRCNVTAEGHFGPGGSIDMHSLDDRRTAYRFSPDGAGRWTFEPIGTGNDPACQTMANLAVMVSNFARNMRVEAY